jgi:hypothetical protein
MKKKSVRKRSPVKKKTANSKRKIKRSSIRKKRNPRFSVQKKLAISLNRLIIFSALFLISLFLYMISRGGVYEDLFFLTSFILAFITILFLILFLIFLIMKGMKK